MLPVGQAGAFGPGLAEGAGCLAALDFCSGGGGGAPICVL